MPGYYQEMFPCSWCGTKFPKKSSVRKHKHYCPKRPRKKIIKGFRKKPKDME